MPGAVFLSPAILCIKSHTLFYFSKIYGTDIILNNKVAKCQMDVQHMPKELGGFEGGIPSSWGYLVTTGYNRNMIRFSRK